MQQSRDIVCNGLQKMSYDSYGALVCIVFVWSVLSSATTAYTLQPIPLQSAILSGTDSCSNVTQLLDSLTVNLTHLISQNVAVNISCILNGMGSNPQCPASSCRAIVAALPNYTSGYYWILSANSTNTSAVQVYCDLIRHLNGSRGWMRVAYLNMSDPAQSCPFNWTTYTAGSYRLCGRSGDNVCFGVNFTTYSVPYYKVSGWVKGFQYYSCDGFRRYGSVCNPCTLEGAYVDGVSITHGRNLRQHLWTYAASQPSGSRCPCYYNTTNAWPAPSYIGSNWYCGGQSGGGTSNYFNYPLWQSGTCPGMLSSCCASSDLPWFYVTLSASITDSLEVRLCSDEPLINEDVRLLNLELYVY